MKKMKDINFHSHIKLILKLNNESIYFSLPKIRLRVEEEIRTVQQFSAYFQTQPEI